MKIRALAFTGLLIAFVALALAPIANGQTAMATPSARASPGRGGAGGPFYGGFVIGRHAVRFDSPECGLAIQSAIREGRPDPRLQVPTAFCQEELNKAMAYLKELPAETPAPETPAARYTPGPPSQ